MINSIIISLVKAIFDFVRQFIYGMPWHTTMQPSIISNIVEILVRVFGSLCNKLFPHVLLGMYPFEVDMDFCCTIG